MLGNRSSRRLAPPLLAACMATVLGTTAAVCADAKENLSGHGVNEGPLRWYGPTPWEPVIWEGQPLEQIVSAWTPPLDNGGLLEPGRLDLELPASAPPGASASFFLPAPDGLGRHPITPPAGSTIPAPGALPVFGLAVLAWSRRRRR